MTETHAQIAVRIAAKAPPGVFAHAARDAVAHNDFTTLQAMFPGVVFATQKVGTDLWELSGACEDGTVAYWGVG